PRRLSVVPRRLSVVPRRLSVVPRRLSVPPRRLAVATYGATDALRERYTSLMPAPAAPLPLRLRLLRWWLDRWWLDPGLGPLALRLRRSGAWHLGQLVERDDPCARQRCKVAVERREGRHQREDLDVAQRHEVVGDALQCLRQRQVGPFVEGRADDEGRR